LQYVPNNYSKRFATIEHALNVPIQVAYIVTIKLKKYIVTIQVSKSAVYLSISKKSK